MISELDGVLVTSRKKQWEQNILKPLTDKFSERKTDFLTDSGLTIDTIYDADMDSISRAELPLPGEYPFTRGIQPNMYRGRLWTMRQYSGYSTPEATNERFKYLLDNGQTGLSIAFDLPTQIGYDSDSPLAKGEVGKVGVPICSVRDMQDLFKGIPMDQVSTSMTINATAAIMLAMYIATAKSQGVDQSKLSGTIQNDILKEYIARGTYSFPPKESMRLVVDSFTYCSQYLPKWNTISISGYHMREAGASATQELGFTFANAIEYVTQAINSGLKIDEFAPRLSFFFVAQNNLLEEVAKFRAARKLWAQIMKERFGAQDERSLKLRFHTQTAGVSLTAQQPDNNVVRCTIQALSAILGGTQSLHVNSKDEALGLPTEDAVQLSLRTQQIIAHESGIADVVDPLGGSYYIEALTKEIETGAMKYINAIDSMGGAVTAIENGYQANEIGESAYKHQTEVDNQDRIVVGVNGFNDPNPTMVETMVIDNSAEKSQTSKLSQLKSIRDETIAQQALNKLKMTAEGTNNLIPVIIECAESLCTTGEISSILREVFGEYDSHDTF
ncbi:MAG: methylmalonyl-CoA mutase [SAR202 cluster bacterium]|nr:methylmalonyl-CoA mutase [SAR202 cluster bacterium]MQG35754.1 methylmalonyl-CoA mutase [SAR202 cluster bacterium]MQG86574.1 methylmalonyl-CoA mutase [SAR202 cluster bacterium]